MPHDDLKEATAAVRDATKWFTCQRGHSYAIGDCGQPKQLGKCPCGAQIGGNNYAFADTGYNVQQQRQADLTDKTRDGMYAWNFPAFQSIFFKLVFLFRLYSWTLGSNGKRTAHWYP